RGWSRGAAHGRIPPFPGVYCTAGTRSRADRANAGGHQGDKKRTRLDQRARSKGSIGCMVRRSWTGEARWELMGSPAALLLRQRNAELPLENPASLFKGLLRLRPRQGEVAVGPSGGHAETVRLPRGRFVEHSDDL